MSNVVAGAARKSMSAMQQVQQNAKQRADSARNSMFEAGMATAAGVAALAYPLKMAANYERLRVSMIALTGSNAAGMRTYREVIRLASETPLQLSEVAKVTTMMIGYGSSAREATESVKMLGDITALTNGVLDNAIVAYGQARQEGKMLTRDLRQFINAGVPIVSILQDVLGAETNVFKMAEEGQITFGLLQEALNKATGAGGRFENGLGKLSSTGEGVFVRLIDVLNRYAATFGEALLPALKSYGETLMPIIDSSAEFIRNHQTLAKVLMGSVIAFTSVAAMAMVYQGAIWLVNAAIVATFAPLTLFIAKHIGLNAILAWTGRRLFFLRFAFFATSGAGVFMTNITKYGLVPAIWKAIAGLEIWSIAQAKLNVLLTANPIGIIIVAISALVGFIAYAVYKWNEFGAALLFLSGPLGAIVNAFMSIKKHWSAITEAFSSKGFLSGILAIGKALFDAVLYPLQQLMGIISKVTGFDWAANAQRSLNKFRVDHIITSQMAAQERVGTGGRLASTGSSTTIAPVSNAVGGSMQLTYNPTVTIGSASESDRKSFTMQLESHKEEIAKMVQDVMSRQQRRSFA
jgi:tape measure domain-containing protein